MIGTYNAVVINSDSTLSDEGRLVKRLDESFGITTPGRAVAATTWTKIPSQEVVKKVRTVDNKPQIVLAQESAPVEDKAVIQEELNLNLVEVINPKIWDKGLPKSEFNGSIATNAGNIESLNVSLPNREAIAISFSEMKGNVFSYDYEGEIYSAMMYQVDQNSYMITLTNGPLEGTRLRFAGEPTPEQAEVQEVLAENYNVEVKQFGGNI